MIKLLRNAWKLIKKAASFLSTALILVALLVSVLFLFRIKPYVVATGSIEPAIPVHSICFVNENTALETISVGEVISFRMGDNMLVTHRVTAIDNGKYTTKGDANNTEDASAVTRDNYIGKTVFVIPGLGNLLIFLKSTPGMIVTVSAIIILLILSFIPDKQTPGSSLKAGKEETDEPKGN